jgi:hypothetical protein
LPGADERRQVRLAALAVVALGIVLGAAPLLVGSPGGDDAYYHAMYAQQHAACWRSGVLHPRWYPGLNDDLGGPEPRTRPLAPLVLHAAFALALDDAVAATALATALIPPVAGLLMLVAARRRGACPAVAGLVGAAWAASPYLLVSLHERAALQEAWALALLPLVLAPLLPPGPADRREALLGAAAVAILAATQLLVAFMAGVILAAAHLAAPRRRALDAGAALLLGLGLSAVSWLPNVVSLGRIQGEVFASGWFDWRNRFVLGGADPDPVLARSMLLVLAGLAASALLTVAGGQGGARWLGAGALLAALLATPLSRPLWEVVPGFALVQFPWRWLGPASCLASLALAAAGRARVRLAGGVLLVAPLLVVPLWQWRLAGGPPLRPSDPAPRVAQAATRYGVPPILPSFPATLPPGVDLLQAVRRGAEARWAVSAPSPAGPREWRFLVRRDAPETATMPLLSDAAWRAEVDGVAAQVREDAGLVAVEVPRGYSEVRLVQVTLPEEVVGAALTVLSLLALALARRQSR